MSIDTLSEKGLFSGLLDKSEVASTADDPFAALAKWTCSCPLCTGASDGQGGSTPGSYSTTPTEIAYRFVSQAPAPTQGSGGSAGALLAGTKWVSLDVSTQKTVISYSFASPQGSTYSYGTGSDFEATLSAFPEADRQLTREILARIEAVANVDFVEVADNATEVGVVRYGYSQQPNAMKFAGYAFFPSSVARGGDVWIGAAQARPEWDFYRPNLILHETLHALGLKHPFDSGLVLATEQDIIPNTVMSYSPVTGTTSGYMSKYPGAPMSLDIAALQYLYGAAATNPGNDVYDVANDDFQSGFRSLWDAGGSDVFDASRVGHRVVLDLRDGAQSDVGAVVNATGYTSTSTVNVSYTATLSVAGGAVIENAVGSAFSDSLTGNAVANRLEGGQGDDTHDGNGGNDVLDGGQGNDKINGGQGLDTAVYAGFRAGYGIGSNDGVLAISGDASGTDTLTSVERLWFDDTRTALDLDGNAGLVAEVLGAVFGAASAHNPLYVGIGLGLVDNGMAPEALVQRALEVRLGNGASNELVVDLLLTNVTGSTPSAADRALYVGLLEDGTYTPSYLGLLMAESATNDAQIDLVGLSATGLDYIA